MKRRSFFQIPLLAAALNAIAADGKQDPPVKGFKVEAGKDRRQEELMIMGGQFDCKVSSKDTNGRLLVYDTVREEKGGPALHFHHSQDEWYYVISGEFLVRIGDENFHLKSGDSAFGPRKIPHAFAKISESPGQMMVLFQPAGMMEDFFKEASKFGRSLPKDQETWFKELSRTHGVEVVGPPINI